jgi:chitin disaccharide deacetylase
VLADRSAKPARYLIVNADDFGYSSGVNRGVIEAHERGIVTSASLMVNQRAAAEAAAYARARVELSLGLHVELERWYSRSRSWLRLLHTEIGFRKVVAAEIRRQLDRFCHLVGRDPTHIDSHHNRHRTEPARSILIDLAQELDVPLRHFNARVRYCGDFYGHIGRGQPNPEAILPEALVDLLGRLSPGVTELCCHPGYGEDVKDWYRKERLQEVRALCDPRVQAAVERLEIRLGSFGDLRLVGEEREEPR